MESKVTYEESIPLIQTELMKRRSQWKLTSIAWMDFKDVEQKILLHLFKQWDKWDQSKPLLPWLNVVISNQIINAVRNNYSNYVRPCLKCPHHAGGTACQLYGKQSASCADYAKWEKGKKRAYDLKLAVSISDERVFGEGNEFDAQAPESASYDFESAVQNCHEKIQDKLTDLEKKVYNFLFILNLSEEETISRMGYKNGGTKTGYKLVKKVRNQIVTKAKEVIRDM